MKRLIKILKSEKYKGKRLNKGKSLMYLWSIKQSSIHTTGDLQREKKESGEKKNDEKNDWQFHKFDLTKQKLQIQNVWWSLKKKTTFEQS